MISDYRIAERYARSFFGLAEKRSLVESLEEELRLVLTSTRSHREFATLLSSTGVSQAEKEKLIEHIFKDQCSELLIHCLKLLVRKGRFSILDRITEKFHELYNEARHIEEVRAVSSHRWTADLEKQLKQVLESKIGKKVLLTTEVDSSLLGGLTIYMKNNVIDGSIKSRIQELRQILVPN